MSWSLPLGRLFGIPIKIHFTFFLLLVFVFFTTPHEEGALYSNGLDAVLFVSVIFACVVVHELGHSLTAARFGVSTQGIVLLPIGGVAFLEQIPKEGFKEIAIALGGPAVSLFLTLLFGTLSGFPLNEFLTFEWRLSFESLFVVNLMLLLFNLLPAFPMDGGRVFRGALSLVFGRMRGTMIAVRIGQGLALFFMVTGLLLPEFFMFFLVGLFIFFGAGEEGKMARLRATLEGVPVQRAMIDRFAAVSPETTLQEALNTLVRCNQDDLPVVDNSGFVGMASQRSIVRGIREYGFSGTIEDIPLYDSAAIGPETDLESLATTLLRQKSNSLAVIEDGGIRGLISWDQVIRYSRLKREIEQG